MKTSFFPLPNWGEGEGRIGEIKKHITSMLVGHSDAPALDADRILLHALGKDDASYLLAHGDEIISEEQAQKILRMAETRKIGMPLAYILGHADFYGRTFTVTPDALIPRPDTELLIDKALEYIKNNFSDNQEILIADICTGSGIIAITLALELDIPYKITATDISPAALAIAHQNAKKHGVADHIEFLQGDMLTPLQGKTFNIVVSNPPYVPSAELADEVSVSAPNLPSPPPSPQLGRGENLSIDTRGLLFEPRIALDGGEDGLQFVLQIQTYAREHHTPAIIETVGGEIIIITK